MRCPYCHVHYLDEEKVCPMCGRRAVRTGTGTTSGGTKPKPEKRGKPLKPASSVKRKPAVKQPPRPAPVNLSGSGWDTPSEHSSRKKRGCLFPFLILLVLFAVITMIANASFTGLTQSGFSVSDLIDSLAGDRCALVAFRRTGLVICPLTSDRGFLRSALEEYAPLKE